MLISLRGEQVQLRQENPKGAKEGLGGAGRRVTQVEERLPSKLEAQS
jgi:hypothetical protein